MRPRAFLDTNLLVLRLIGQLTPDLIGSHKRVRAYRPGDLEGLNEILAGQRLCTNVAVLTETSNLLGAGERETPAGAQRALASFAGRAEIIATDINAICKLPVLVRYGFTDASLVLAALSGITVVTDDFPLAGLMAKRDLPVINFNALRTGR